MKPEIHLLGISIKTFGVMFALGFIACGMLVARRLRELDRPADWAYEIVFAALIGGIVGALLTGVFVLSPLAWLDKRPGVTVAGVLRNWGLVFIGNFAGALTVAFMMAFVTTFGFTQPPDKVGTALGAIGEARTLGYASHGAAGMATLFVRGILCNWMVSTGVVGAMISTTVPGKVIAMWMPILVFFYMVFEHSVVNMFLFPSGLMLHAKFSIMDYLIWNEIPTVLGNLVGGLSFTGLTLYATHVRTAPKRELGTAPKRMAA